VPLRVAAALTPGQASATATLDVLGNEETVTATLDPELTGELRFAGRLGDLAAVHTLCRFADVPLPLELLPGEAQAKVYERRRDVLCDGLERVGWPIVRPRATMFVWAKIPEPWAAMGSFEFAMKLLEGADVVGSPGAAFGPSGEGYIRLALVENENRLRQAVRRIGRCLGAKTASKGLVEAK